MRSARSGSWLTGEASMVRLLRTCSPGGMDLYDLPLAHHLMAANDVPAIGRLIRNGAIRKAS